MQQPQPLPVIVRVVFLIHLIVAILIGLGLLLIPTTVGSWFGYPPAADLEPVVRGYGAMILGMGALTSLYGVLARRWEPIKYIVHGEVTFLALQTIVYVVSAVLGRGPAFGNWFFGILSAVLLVLFVIAFFAGRRTAQA